MASRNETIPAVQKRKPFEAEASASASPRDRKSSQADERERFWEAKEFPLCASASPRDNDFSCIEEAFA